MPFCQCSLKTLTIIYKDLYFFLKLSKDFSFLSFFETTNIFPGYFILIFFNSDANLPSPLVTKIFSINLVYLLLNLSILSIRTYHRSLLIF
jgi:hypothetical protein